MQEDKVFTPSETPKVDIVQLEIGLQNNKEKFTQYFAGLNEYWKTHAELPQFDQKSLPPMFHGTRMSALTGIRMRGLVPVYEKNRQFSSVYATINPHSAAAHLLEHSNFDTFLDRPKNSNQDDDDPPVILKIDTEKFYQDKIARMSRKEKFQDFLKLVFQFKSMHVASRYWQSLLSPGEVVQQIKREYRVGLSSIEAAGTPLFLDKTIPAEYIKVLTTGSLAQNPNMVEEISLDDAYQRLLQM